MGEENRFFSLLCAASHAARDPHHGRTPTIPEEVKGNLPFVTFEDTLYNALWEARKIFSNLAEVLIFPNDGMSFPHLKR